MVFYFWEVIKKLSGVGFEPTPTYVDQNAHVPRSTVVNISAWVWRLRPRGHPDHLPKKQPKKAENLLPPII